MKNTTKSISLVAVTAAIGAICFALANSSFTAGTQGETILATAASLAIVSLAVYDYARRPRSLATAKVLRPTLPAAANERPKSHDQPQVAA